MIVHLFNSSSISGPERLVLPALAPCADRWTIVNLVEERHVEGEDPLKTWARELNLPYLGVRVRSRWDRAAVADLGRRLRALAPEAVHAHDVKASIYLLSSVPAPRPFAILSTHHGIHGRPDLKTRIYEWVYRKHFLHSFSRVLCVSTPDFNDMRSSGIPDERLRLHRNGASGVLVAASERAQRSETIRQEWLPETPLRSSLFLFGVVGRLSKEKDHARLLRVLDRLNHATPDDAWQCLVFGDGALARPLKDLSARLGLTDRVRWMGYRSTVSTEIAGLDVLLSFSRAEGLPINLLEAGWAGTAVAATTVGGVNDLIPDERYGERIAPEEPIEQTAQRLRRFFSTEGRQSLRRQAEHFQRRVTTEFTQKQWLQRLLEIYQELGLRVQADSSGTGSIACG